MSDTLYISKVNETYIRIDCQEWMARELSDYFSFKVPNAKFVPAYKNKMWDGTIRLYNTFAKTLYTGLLPAVENFASTREYKIDYSDDVFADQEVSEVEIEEFLSKLKNKNLLPFKPADDQRQSITQCFRKKRITVLSPTGSGKSFIIYLNLWWWKKKSLIIVPTVGLVAQMQSDLTSYGIPAEYIHCITAGEEKKTNKPITIATWQSIYKLNQSYFHQFEVIIGDEVHRFKANSLTSIMTKASKAAIRIGLTGSLDDSQCNQMVIKGLFGDIYRASTTAELQEKGRLAALNIKCIALNYDQEIRKLHSKDSYQDEISFLVTHTPRNRFLTNLACSLKGNTLVLFKRTDTHAKVVYDMIGSKTSSPLHYIDGGVDMGDRERIRQAVTNSSDNIIVASYGTMSTGVNIPNIDNVIFASPSKSKILVLQSIGRSLRLAQNKQQATLYDIADNLIWKSHENYSIIHFKERLELYNNEQFDYKLYNVELKKET